MKQYVDKTSIVEEIEKRKKEAELNCGGYKSYDEHRCDACTVDFYEEFLEILNTFETKEVDLERETTHYLLYEHLSPLNEIMHKADIKAEMQYHKDIEKAFKAGFELGLKSKGE